MKPLNDSLASNISTTKNACDSTQHEFYLNFLLTFLIQKCNY